MSSASWPRRTTSSSRSSMCEYPLQTLCGKPLPPSISYAPRDARSASNRAGMLPGSVCSVSRGWPAVTGSRALSCSDSQGDGVSTMVPGSSMNLADMNPSKTSAGLANGAPQNGPVQSHPLTPNATGMVAH